ncbi:MAG: tRNA (5-methylaminomethyl-2-thiouridine)(34)-methyltransferase MnmD [Candidatus Marinarcus sp.]|uniref:tRNA (5-methylaminomethyl-2-thiouridine)(34)-methyltransferase MnmD n=1 Tax=Candidatus Marinarcus sp. TaxID=3100987 RepID=UPI003B004996
MIVTTQDGSNTLFSKAYNQHYHNIKEGAVFESLSKHVIPALTFHQNKKHLRILDICFGLGYNTLSTLYYLTEHKLNLTLEIFSPELDEALIESLIGFKYPKEFETLLPIIQTLAKDKKYEDEKIKIELFIGNARDYVKTLTQLDIVYQDAFSSEVNSELWSVEYFKDIYKACSKNAIITTYAIATPIRLSMHEAGFSIYEFIPQKRKITLGFKQKQSFIGKYVDMELKKIRNKEAKSLVD